MLTRRVAVVVAVLAGLLLAMAAPARAHAELITVLPGLTPGTVVLLFSEDVDAAHSLVTVDHVRQSPVPVGARELAIALPHGTSVVTWRVVSAEDGHAEAGSRRIDPVAVGAVNAMPVAVVASDPGALSTDLLLDARIVQYFALVLLVGGLAFLSLVWPAGAEVPRTRNLLALAAMSGAVSALAGLGLQQLSLTDARPSSLLHLATWAHAVQGHVGEVWLARALLWSLTLPLLRAVRLQGEGAARSRGWRIASLAVALGLLRTIGLTSHGAASAHERIGAAADLVHLLAASLWLGGLTFLAVVVLPRRSVEELTTVLPRFSKVALVSVTTVVGAGLVLSWDLVGSVHELLASGYGHRLLVKLALVLLLLLAALRSKGFVQRQLDVALVLDGDRAALRPLVLSVTAEACLGAAVLSAAAVLATSAPVH